MNPPIRRLAIVVVLMFFTLMLGATSVQFFRADELNSHAANVRTVYREFGRDRGPIIVAGEAVARSTPVDDAYGYQRVYPEGELYSHVTGYFSTAHNSLTGLELSENAVLNGTADSLLVQRLQALITGQQPQGGAVELTLDPEVQRVATEALGDRPGAVVALDPGTGAIRALVSTPGYDPNALASRDRAEADAAWQAYNSAENNRPIVNRAIAGDQYAPGSSFKVITAAAALENGDYTPDSMVPGPTELDLPQTDRVIRNPGQLPCGDGSGEVTLTTAMRESCNTPFAALAMEMGADELRTQAEAFGFGEELEIPLGVTPSRYPAEPTPPEVAMTGMGQADVRATPLQMAMVAAAVANEGVQMQPYLVERELTPDLSEVARHNPSELREAVSAETASQLAEMMREVVAEGTGRPAQIPGVDVYGKTGTAEVSADVDPHAWFIGYADAGDGPEIAVAVVVEHGGYGSDVSAPIARDVMAAALGGDR